MSMGIVLEDVCRVLAVLCLIAALVTAAAAVVLLFREGLTERVRDEIKSKYTHRVGLLVFLAVCVWLLAVGQNAYAAEAATDGETVPDSEAVNIGETVSAGEIASVEETEETEKMTDADEAAVTGMTVVETAGAEEPTGLQEPPVSEEPSEQQESSGMEEPIGLQEPSGTGEPSEPQEAPGTEEPSEPQEQAGPQDLQAPVVYIETTEEVNEDEEGNIFCRADNAGIRIVMEENREEDTGVAEYRIVITDSEGNEFCKEWEYIAGSDPEQQEGEQEERQGRLDRTEITVDPQEISTLADGLITVNAEAEDASGNRGESGFSYILDTEEPELTQILTFKQNGGEEVRAEGGILYDDGDLYYRDEQLVTRILITDASPVTWQIAYLEQPGSDQESGQETGPDQEPESGTDAGLEPGIHQSNIARQVSGNKPEGSVAITEEGTYSDWSISGEDIAGNKLRVAADCECTQDAEELYEEAGEIRMPRRKILDRTAPIGEIFYESTAVGYLYKEESGEEVFWNADVEVSLRVQDSCAGQEMPVDAETYGFLVWKNAESGQSVADGPAAEEPDGAEIRPAANVPIAEEPAVTEDGKVLISTFRLDSDGRAWFGAYGRDRAGNPMTVREVIGTDVAVRESQPDDELTEIEHRLTIGADIPGQGDPADCRPCTPIVRDTTCPTLTASVSLPVGNPDAVDDRNGIVYYGRNGNQYIGGTPVLNASFIVSDRNIDERRMVTLWAYADVPEGENCEEVMPERVKEVSPDQVEFASDNETQAIRFRLIRYPGRDGTPDGVYRFGIQGTDKAGNPLRLKSGRDEDTPADGDHGAASEGKETLDELNGVVCVDSENGMFLTGRKVVDTAAPSGDVRIENKTGTVYCHIREHSKVWITERDDFMPYRREREAVIRYSGEDTSPVSVSCRIRSTSGGNNEAAPDGSTYNIPCRSETGIRGEQIFRIENVVFRDRAGNESSVLGRTVNFYLDTRLPNTDIDAPSARVNTVSATYDRGTDGRPLYAGDVTLEVSAEDPYRELGASGLHEVRYEVEIDGKIGRSATLFSGEGPSPDPESENEPEYEYNGRIEIPSGGQWESSDIVVRVTAEDNAGNRSDQSEGGIFRFGIDTTGPEVTVRYDNNDVRNGLYFNKERVATISVRERHFDAGAIAVNAPGAQIGTWRLTKSKESVQTGTSDAAYDNSADDAGIWIMEVRFPADGIYTLDVNGADAAGNPASVRYEGEAARAFVVDGTPPRIEVIWDNTDVRNGKYYNRERRATVRITDLSFSEDRVTILPASTGFHQVAGATRATLLASATRATRIADREGQSDNAEWVTPTAQIYEMELPFTEEGEWMLSCACTDLAGNTAVPVTEPLFVLDWTGPRLYFDKGTVQEKGAYADTITPLLRWEEENPSSAACYAAWINVTAGGMTMECRNSVSSVSAKGEGKTVLPNPPDTKETDGICLLYGTACDLAGNRAFVRRNLSVNRLGSLYDLSEDEETLQTIGSYYTEGRAPFAVAEYNISPLVKRQVTLYTNGIAHVLMENTDYTVEETSGREGHKYVYRIDPSVFQQEGVYSLLFESDDAAGRHNSSPGRFVRKYDSLFSDNGEESSYSPEWAIDRTLPTVRITGIDISQHRFVTDKVSLTLIPEDNMELQRLTVRITDDNGAVLIEQILEKDELREILDSNRGEVPVEIKASGKWQTLTASVTDGAGNSAEEQKYRLLVSSNLLVHLYRSGLLPAVAFLAFITVIRIKLKGKKLRG